MPKERWRRPGTTELLAIGVAAFFDPMTLWASNLAEIGWPDGVVLWSLLVWVGGLGLWALLVRVGMEAGAAMAAVVVVLLGMGDARWMMSDAMPGGPAVAFFALVVAAAVVAALFRFGAMRWIVIWLVVYLAVAPFANAVTAWMTGDASLEPLAEVPPLRFAERPDVVVVVFDALGSPRVLEADYGIAPGAFDALRRRGLVVPPAFEANYTLTHVSLASFFRMDYPVEAGVSVGEAEWKELMAVINGANPLVDTFKANGYRFVLVESGWSGVHCTASADLCVRGGWPDDAASTAISNSVVGFARVWNPESGPVGARRSIGWLRSDLVPYLEDGVPDLIFLHLLMPHPPVRLDPTCQPRDDGGEGLTVLSFPGIGRSETSTRRSLYRDQVDCALRTVGELAELVGDRGIFVAVGDHGPDSRMQLFTPPELWSETAVVERFGAFLATNARGCGWSEVGTLVNVGRRLLSCLSGTDVPPLGDRRFIVVQELPLVEISPG